MKKSQKQPGKNRRSRTKHPALRPELNLKSRWELIDYDYISDLSEKDKEWLNRFTEEYVGANFKHSGDELHNTKELKRDCYSRNNARNRDILTKMKASGKIEYLEELVEIVYKKEETLRDEEIPNVVDKLKHSDEEGSK